MSMSARRLALALSFFFAAGSALADSTPQTLPFSQDWSNTGLITANDNWSGVPGIEGYLGQDITTATGTDPQTLTGTSAVANDLSVLANQTSQTVNNGDAIEFEIANPAVGLQGSGTADAPYLVVNLNTTGSTGINVAYNLRDIDSSADNAIQQVALQYRVGSTGSFVNVPAGYVADATTAGSATQVTPVSALLPAAADNQALVQVRIITTNAAGNDESVGIDDIAITAGGTGGNPVLSVNDTSAAEGNAGTTPFFFTFTLNQPAGAGGLAIQYATANGTATAGDDYVAQADTATIAAGATSVTIGVPVNGDTTTEPNETFFVDILAAPGATIADAQGVGTINNDDVSITPIHDIQGNGQLSPLSGQSVTTRGVVTGRKSNGFFLQTPDAEADADPMTSEGVFVFTSTAPPASAALGNSVLVAGTVVEFIPTADLGQLPLTEISAPTSIVVLSTGNPMPAPVSLTPTFPDPAGPLDQLERVEGMRVTAASFTVVSPTGGTTNEPNATGSSNGQLNLVVTGVARPFREPGIQAPDPAPGGGSIPPIPRWDFNPELLFSDTDGIGATPLSLNAGATVEHYVGPMDYGFRRYSIHLDPSAAVLITQGPAPTAARAPTADEFTVAAYNMERFFDTVNDAGVDDPVLTATAFANRLNKASLGIRNFLNTPDILAVVEMENLAALQAVAAKVNADATAASQPDPQYVAYLQEGNDVGGIDVGFLVKTREVAAGIDRVEVVAVTQHGKDTTWVEPSGSTSLLNDRPPLALDAIVHYADGRTFPITVIAVHQRSLNGAETNDADGARVRAKRQRQAEFLADLIDDMQTAAPDRRITVLGDFNAFEFNDGLVDAMNVVTGTPTPDNQTAVPGDGVDLVATDLLNLALEEPADQRYSFLFGGNAQSLDHVVVNQALAASVGAYDLDHARINADFPEITRSNPSTASRLADHDPMVAYFSVASADLSIDADATPASVAPGGAMTFSATVDNDGPSAAAFPGVGFAFDASLPDLAITPPSGWTCDAPTIGANSTLAACAANELVNGQSASFQLTAVAPAGMSGQSITMAASVDSDSFDPVSANNSDQASVGVTAVADLRTDIIGPVRMSSTVSYSVAVLNSGPNAATAASVRIVSNLPLGIATHSTPLNWTCTQAATSTLDITCLSAVPFVGSAEFGVSLPNAYNKPQYKLRSTVTSGTQDPNPANNTKQRMLGPVFRLH